MSSPRSTSPRRTFLDGKLAPPLMESDIRDSEPPTPLYSTAWPTYPAVAWAWLPEIGSCAIGLLLFTSEHPNSSPPTQPTTLTPSKSNDRHPPDIRREGTSSTATGPHHQLGAAIPHDAHKNRLRGAHHRRPEPSQMAMVCIGAQTFA